MDQAGPSTALVFNLEKGSPFAFKCQVCSACCTNKAIRIAPYEALRLARNLKTTTTEIFRLYTEGDEAVLRNKPDGGCIFLGSRGCGVHPDRPLVCRLFPLGQITDGLGIVKYASMPLHPDCLGLFSLDGTVASYLESQGTLPYFQYDQAYSSLGRKIAGKRAGRTPSTLPSPWFDIDAFVSAYCRLKKREKPEIPDEIVKLHLQAVEEWTAGD